MMRKMLFIAFLGVSLVLSSSAYAESADGHSMGMEGRYQHGAMHKEESQCPVAGKFMMKSHFLLENQKELGLTGDQVKSIKDLKLQVEKDSIRQTADMKVFMLDLNSKLEEDKIDVEGTNALIDKGFAAATAGAKSNLEAYAKLKGLLTPDQVTKMKELFQSKKESWKNREK